jgi:hypothetical protein
LIYYFAAQLVGLQFSVQFNVISDTCESARRFIERGRFERAGRSARASEAIERIGIYVEVLRVLLRRDHLQGSSHRNVALAAKTLSADLCPGHKLKAQLITATFSIGQFEASNHYFIRAYEMVSSAAPVIVR